MDTDRVHFLTIEAADDGQRVDNFIRKRYPNLPKSRIYQMLRKGEARLNKKRIKPTDRIQTGDMLRLPPIPDGTRQAQWVPPRWQEVVKSNVLYEDDDFLIINKPAGLAVHSGSGQEFGVIDVVRSEWGEHYAELAHRLDRETSGCLVLGKHRDALAVFQQAMQDDEVEKRYWCLVAGQWDANCTEVSLKLAKRDEGMVVADDGKDAHTWFFIIRALQNLTLLEALLDTGRTHQIRVSVAEKGHPIIGDGKYGDFALNRRFAANGFEGMFLHARSIRFTYKNKVIQTQAPLPEKAQHLLDKLEEVDHDL
ncbi:RluA family pseudouridine synthase [Cardiobacteriaceae bacterium TAE3-ERU3]|nr:RluA family pseudouridine synthase [Cardiobacteriaceae bacterium TAE3-ERU3]